MKEKNSKTKYLVGAFLATALVIYGCGSDTEENAEPVENGENLGQRLADDTGAEYTLIDNGDGTETARYDDGRAVTFRRQEDGSLDYVAGVAGLIAGMAASYYLFHGFSNTAPVFEVSTDSWRRSGFITLSCFVLGGAPSAVYCRFSQNKIIGTEAYFVPLVVD